MTFRSWLPTAALALVFAGLSSGADTDDKPKKEKEPADPPGTALYMNQFRALFDQWDLDKDGFLDKEELAKAFRGPKAKPFDAAGAKPESDLFKDETKKDDAKKDETKKDDAKKDETKKDSSKSDSSKSDTKDPKKPDYSKFADYNFLTQLDQDNDQKISRKEFMSWARDYSKQLKEQADAQKQILETQRKLATHKPTSAEYKRLQAQLNREQDHLNKTVAKVNKQVRAFERQLQASLNKTGKK